jgi:hypothetical protein
MKMHEQLGDGRAVRDGPDIEMLFANKAQQIDDDAIVAVPGIKQSVEQL